MNIKRVAIITICFMCVWAAALPSFAADADDAWHKRLFGKSTTPIYYENKNLWQHVQRNVKLKTHMNRPEVAKQYDWYTQNSQYLYRILGRAEPYLFTMVDILQSYNLPPTLVLIPIVESGYDPFAFSHGTAAGLWQLLPATASHYGVEQNWWYDGRRDIVDSTHAAAQYLSYLYSLFDGDWLLAFAAYNAGQGTVKKAIRNNQRQGKPTDFWSLSLPRETQQYVPKLLALAEIIKNPNKANIELPFVPHSPLYEVVDLGYQLDLSVAANLANVSLAELYRMNPGYNHWATAPDGPHRLLIPAEAAGSFQHLADSLPKTQRVNWTRYTIKNGDSLSTIASRYQTSIQVLQGLNNLDSHQIKSGMALLIPTSNMADADYTLDLKQLNIPGLHYSNQEIQHTVLNGDSLWKVAKQYNVTINDLMKWNNLSGQQFLQPGQKIKIVRRVTSDSFSSNRPEIVRKIHYRVRRGESLGVIAKRFKVSINDLKTWNGLSDDHALKYGENLILYVDITKQSA